MEDNEEETVSEWNQPLPLLVPKGLKSRAGEILSPRSEQLSANSQIESIEIREGDDSIENTE